jgi:hypothetical protein
MNKYTVFFAHELPLRMGVAAYWITNEEAYSPEEAGEKCKRSVGGYATVLAILEGHHSPVYLSQHTFTEEKIGGGKVALIPPPNHTIGVSNKILRSKASK